jgi:hypothetical protein
MRAIARFVFLASIVVSCGHVAVAQTLAPRAYVITPTGANAVTLSWSFFDGGLNFNGTVPITGATGVYNIPAVSYYRSFSLLGRGKHYRFVALWSRHLQRLSPWHSSGGLPLGASRP